MLVLRTRPALSPRSRRAGRRVRARRRRSASARLDPTPAPRHASAAWLRTTATSCCACYPHLARESRPALDAEELAKRVAVMIGTPGSGRTLRWRLVRRRSRDDELGGDETNPGTTQRQRNTERMPGHEE